MTTQRTKVSGSRFKPTVPAGSVYIGRAAPYLPASPFANRHPIGRRCPICGIEHDRADAVDAYARDLDAAPQLVEQARRELNGWGLACWCPTDPSVGPCHGDVLDLVVTGVDPLAAWLARKHALAGRRELAEQVAGVSRALAAVAGPELPRDGDCLLWEPKVRRALYVGGFAASAGAVLGLLDLQGEVIAFSHAATLVGDVVIDLTARQFDPHLPRRWFAGIDDYCARLGAATGCDRVTVHAASIDQST